MEGLDPSRGLGNGSCIGFLQVLKDTFVLLGLKLLTYLFGVSVSGGVNDVALL